MPVGLNISEPAVLQGPLGADFVGPRHHLEDTGDDHQHRKDVFHITLYTKKLSFYQPHA